MKPIGFALLGFVGTYAMFFVFRWWPTAREDVSDLPQSRVRRVELICAAGAALAAGVISLLAG